MENLSHLLMTNKLLLAYIMEPSIAINNLLRGNVSETSKDYIYDLLNNPEKLEPSVLAELKDMELDFVAKGNIYVDTVPYNPLTLSFVRNLTQLDAVMRASKAWNDKPITVYRGCKLPTNGVMNEIISTSETIKAAHMFADECLLKINLPANFPYLKMSECQMMDTFEYEKEIILPPCNYEIIGEWTDDGKEVRWLKENKPNVKLLEINVEPKSLAKTFLKRLKNMPADYPRRFMMEKEYQYGLARNELDGYVKKFVDKKKIPLIVGTFDEIETKGLSQGQPQ